MSLIQQALRKHSKTPSAVPRSPGSRGASRSPVRGASQLIPVETIELTPKKEGGVNARLMTLAIISGLLTLAALFTVAGYFLTGSPGSSPTPSPTQTTLYLNNTFHGTDTEALFAETAPADNAPVAAPASASAPQTFSLPAPEPAGVPAAQAETPESPPQSPEVVMDVDALASFEKPAAVAARADETLHLVRRTPVQALRFYGPDDPRNKVFAANRLLRQGDLFLENPELKIARILQSAVILVDETGREFRKPILGR
ncbi:MAG: hypothetical protein ACFB20_08520 [Opitutales bacterium]